MADSAVTAGRAAAPAPVQPFNTGQPITAADPPAGLTDDEKTLHATPDRAGPGSSNGDSSSGTGHDNGFSPDALAKADSKVVSTKFVATDKDNQFAHLPSNEAEILRLQVAVANTPKGAKVLYRYASRSDIAICIFSLILAIAAGVALPLMTIIFGSLQQTFQDFFTGQSSYDDFLGVMTHNVLYFVYLAIGEFITVYISTVGFLYTGEHISDKIREKYLQSCLQQNIGFFDKLGAGEVTTRITADINLLQDGISEKVPITISAIATFFAAFVIGFIKYWKLTLILTSTFFALVLNMVIWSRFVISNSKRTTDEYAEGGSLAAEAISSIRNAVAFGTEDRLARLYDQHLIRAEKYGFRAKAAIGMMIAGMLTCLYLNYGLAFWMGSIYITSGVVSLSTVLTIALAVIIGAFSIGNITPNIQAFVTAISAANKIFNTIDRYSPLDPNSDSGDRLEHLEGTIRFEHIKHIYPSRPEVVVMRDVSLTIPAGKTTALVGASGSGKSTIVGLVERFYSPVGGTIFLDGHDITKLNLRWLRQQISLVSQEPVLFDTTIFTNIAYGLIGSLFENESKEKKRDRVYEAAIKANAHDFIQSLPEGYETNVGERGFLMSGGQKQRIAIARAIVSDPKILLLDEATSALDTKSEGVVQAALETAAAGRTTVSIAHRLSTIKDAHNIVVMSEGSVVEQGTHNDLLERRGAYYQLVLAQSLARVSESNVEVDNDEEKLALAKEDEMMRTASRTYGSQGAGASGVAVDPDDDIAAKLNRLNTTKSASSFSLQGQKAGTPEPTYSVWTLIKLIASFNKAEWWYMMLPGIIACIISGGGNPTQAVFFAKEITVLSTPLTASNADQIRSDSNFWSRMYLMLGLVMFAAFTVHGVLLAKASERLVHKVRDGAFRQMLRQEIAYFDQKENSVGALTSFLSTQATQVAGMSGSTLGTLLLVMTTLVAALTLAIAIGWKLGLVCASTVPVLLGCGFFRFWMLAHFQRQSRTAYAASATYASEAISAIRTVASLTREVDILDQYRVSLEQQQRLSLRSVLQSSLLYAASQSLTFLCFALGFWYGGTLIAKGEYDQFHFFLCFMAVIFGAQSAGIVFSFAPDMGKAYKAASELKTLFDRKSGIDAQSTSGDVVESIEGTVEFRDVHFRYPTRPEQPVLRGLNLIVHPGQYVALVGASGCGKSTTIALMERFYDPHVGGVFVDGREISGLNLRQYRSFLALVSQEPTLYQGTIRQNILLGTQQLDVAEEAIQHACREANIYDFISSLPAGLDTLVGSGGTLLSGGQKQRIAIARALIRDPKILLLDEATSALDSESEHVVQAALDKAARGRTTIAVAHRLSTIQNADVIYVFDQGRICEQGTHGELMKRNGRYAELVNLQSLDKN